MTAVMEQLSLLDLLPKPETPPPDTGPATCKWCKREEPSGFLLENNHYPDSPRSLMDKECIAMNLTRSHVQYWCMVIDGKLEAERCCWSGAHKKCTFQTALEHLRHDVARAREVWPGELTWLPEMVEAVGIPAEEVTP